MQLNKDGKVCVECKADLARHWGNNFCTSCFSKLLQENLAEEDKRHAVGRNVQMS